MHMVKNTLNSYGKSGICIFNTQTYCLTMENVHLIAALLPLFTVMHTLG